MSDRNPQINAGHRLIGSIALLGVILALLVNIIAFAWFKPYGILRDLSALAQARELIHTRFVGEVDDQAMLDAALKGLADSLGDQNTEYLSAQELASFNEHFVGEFSGIGAEIDIYENRLRIVAPLDDSPAWNAGVLPGDIVLEIDGEDTEGIDILQAMAKLKGKAGTKVTIKVRHLDGTIQDFTITRDKIEVASVRGYRRDPGNGFDYMLDPDLSIAYVRLTQFGNKSYDELVAVLSGLKKQGMSALILDLRNNGGGLLEAAVAISDLFLTEGQTIVRIEGKGQQAELFESKQETLLPDIPVVVLVNQHSASASEIVAGALADNDRALIVGTRTFGKGSVQQLIELSEGTGALKLTTAYWYIPSGRLIHRKQGAEQWGVDPSPGSFVPMDEDRVRAMLLKRRASEADDPYANLQGPITPDWLRDTLLDDQLAASLDAAQHKLTTGDWPQVGVSKEQALAEPTELEQLNNRRKRLVEQLEEVDRRLDELNPEAEAVEPAADTTAEEETATPARTD